jgi:hypothetical protein
VTVDSIARLGDSLSILATVVVSSVMLVSGVSKLRDLGAATVELLDYRLVPEAFAMPAAGGLALANVGAGAGLLIGVPGARWLCLGMLLVYSMAIASALLRGLRIDCHCGPSPEPMGAETLARNAVLMAALAIEAPAPTPISAIVAGSLAAGLLLAVGCRYLIPKRPQGALIQKGN